MIYCIWHIWIWKVCRFFVYSNGKHYLIQLITHLSEHSDYVDLYNDHKNGWVEWAKLNNAIPLLVSYYPNINGYISVDIRSDKEIG